MIVARELLRRYPSLRASWPIRRAIEWRQERGYRQQPRQMASWFRDMPDMRTRLCISNLEMAEPGAATLCRPTWISASLLAEDGAPLGGTRFRLDRGASRMVELSDLLPKPRRGLVPSGQLQVRFEGPHLGSSRAYLHWYNDQGLTSSHEKFGKTIPAVGGYWTVPNVQHDEGYRTHLAVVNLDETRVYTSSVVLKDATGATLQAELELPPNGSRFVSLDELFPDPGGFLGTRPGILYFGNNHQPAMYYYFIANPTRGTWRAQHL